MARNEDAQQRWAFGRSDPRSRSWRLESGRSCAACLAERLYRRPSDASIRHPGIAAKARQIFTVWRSRLVKLADAAAAQQRLAEAIVDEPSLAKSKARHA
jgi:hypothetical protein